MSEALFLDTACAIALSTPGDRFHSQAILLADQIEAAGSLVTTQAVLLEIGSALSRQRYRSAAVRLLEAIQTDPRVEVIPLTHDLYARALHLYRERPGKEWGLIDCISFIVMQERGITQALTTDEHFQQAGFRALLRDLASSSARQSVVETDAAAHERFTP